MEPPVAFDGGFVREQKAQVFRSIRPMSVEDVVRFTLEGSMVSGMIDGKRVPGYRQRAGSESQFDYRNLRRGFDDFTWNWRWRAFLSTSGLGSVLREI